MSGSPLAWNLVEVPLNILYVEMLDQIQETQDKTRNIRKLNPYPRQEQEILFLGSSWVTQEIPFLGSSWVTQEIPKKSISWVNPRRPKK